MLQVNDYQLPMENTVGLKIIETKIQFHIVHAIMASAWSFKLYSQSHTCIVILRTWNWFWFNNYRTRTHTFHINFSLLGMVATMNHVHTVYVELEFAQRSQACRCKHVNQCLLI